jgi:SAM-dependent methyltransferase
MHDETAAGYEVFDLTKFPVVPDTHFLASKKLQSLKYDASLFANKTVSDLGCSLGFFAFYALGLGAKQVKAYDFKELYVQMGQIAADKYVKLFPVTRNKLEFCLSDLSKLPQIETSQVVICNALIHWFVMKGIKLGNIISWLSDITSEVVLFEGTVSAKEKVMVDHRVPLDAMSLEMVLVESEKRFSRVEKIGTCLYNPERLVLRLWK